MSKRILDPCCGSRMFWFDRKNPDVVFCDNRVMDNKVIWEGKNGEKRYLTIRPDIVADVRDLPFEDESFYHIVFDPPHLVHVGDKGWMGQKYGRLDKDWTHFIHDAFVELYRVLKPNGTLIFKWSEVDISLRDILDAIPYNPLYGHRTKATTIWLAFMKEERNE